MKFAIHQFNPIIGDIQYNSTQIINAANQAKLNHADVLVSSELSLCGYPPEDLLLRPSFIEQCELGVAELLEKITDILVIFGSVKVIEGKLYNCALASYNGNIVACYAKRALPNYGVFDEKRYFVAGVTSCIFTHNGCRIALAICEDIWQADVGVSGISVLNSDILVSLNASPFEINKPELRYQLLSSLSSKLELPILYVNQVCGQDELIFDGGSCVVNQANYCVEPEYFTEYLAYFDLANPTTVSAHTQPKQEELVYNALKLAIYDYVHKNKFESIVLGFSGGIDSALVLAICVDALGANRVRTVMMPTEYTQEISLLDSREMVNTLGVKYDEYSISALYSQYLGCFEQLLGETAPDTTEENIQARIRGNILMAISNKTKSLVVTTGNKSEMTTGYATLYGDMAGGFALLKDVSKCLVYKLATYRNSLGAVIPSRIITRAPSAELRDGQFDQQSLPEYDVLDGIIELIMEQGQSSEDIIKLGYNSADVSKVARLMKLNEYKRKQAAVGPKITARAYGKDWRMPNTHNFNY